jgi:hypothetical protein
MVAHGRGRWYESSAETLRADFRRGRALRLRDDAPRMTRQEESAMDYILLLVVIPGVFSVFIYILLQFIDSARRHRELLRGNEGEPPGGQEG